MNDPVVRGANEVAEVGAVYLLVAGVLALLVEAGLSLATVAGLGPGAVLASLALAGAPSVGPVGRLGLVLAVTPLVVRLAERSLDVDLTRNPAGRRRVLRHLQALLTATLTAALLAVAWLLGVPS